MDNFCNDVFLLFLLFDCNKKCGKSNYHLVGKNHLLLQESESKINKKLSFYRLLLS